MSKVLSGIRFGLFGAVLTTALARPTWAQTADLPSWIHADLAARTVLLDLAVTHPAGAPSALISGEHDGAIQVIVPRGWTIKWHWINQDSTANHSLVVVAEREKLPQQGGQAVFTNAMTRSVLPGLPVGRTDDTSFEAEDGGWFWVLCGVPGHAIAGEWIGLKIDPAATEVGAKKKGA
jgi:Sulfocyanin (SoxE) domain